MKQFTTNSTKQEFIFFFFFLMHSLFTLVSQTMCITIFKIDLGYKERRGNFCYILSTDRKGGAHCSLVYNSLPQPNWVRCRNMLLLLACKCLVKFCQTQFMGNELLPASKFIGEDCLSVCFGYVLIGFAHKRNEIYTIKCKAQWNLSYLNMWV